MFHGDYGHVVFTFLSSKFFHYLIINGENDDFRLFATNFKQKIEQGSSNGHLKTEVHLLQSVHKQFSLIDYSFAISANVTHQCSKSQFVFSLCKPYFSVMTKSLPSIASTRLGDSVSARRTRLPPEHLLDVPGCLQAFLHASLPTSCYPTLTRLSAAGVAFISVFLDAYMPVCMQSCPSVCMSTVYACFRPACLSACKSPGQFSCRHTFLPASQPVCLSEIISDPVNLEDN